MKLALVVSLLLLLPFFLQQAQGIRPEKGFLDQQQKSDKLVVVVVEKKSSSSSPSMEERSSPNDHDSNGRVLVVGEDGVVVCKEGQECKNTGYESIMNDGELVNHGADSTSIGASKKDEGKDGATTTTTGERGDDGGPAKKFLSEAHSDSNHHGHHNEENVNGEGYMDMMDVAEMDYSTARRKPPIHN
ncbi:unnamed protein product [Linum tenue]|uniref:Uncharacterized protein n=1 Tax=Linum tenue TaxID=586396 RepID=A0AAV0HVG4_9ROSI|nr:unnamed protein product [Linum tenue]